jgi:aldehyde dehydrogenase (NAD+)
MGGKNAIIVMDDADIDLAVEGAIWGAFGTSGQRCTASSRLIVTRKFTNSFVSKLVENTKALRVGNGADPKTDVGPVINNDAVEKIMSYIRIGRNDDGATLACGGKRLTKGRLRERSFIRADQ